MSTARPFAYNTGDPISGTTQLGDLAIGTPITGFTDSPLFWNGPDEDLRYIIARPVPTGNQPNPVTPSIPAYVGFWGTPLGDKTDGAFLTLANYVGSKYGQPPFATPNDAVIWLNSNGFWTNYNSTTPTPTPTATQTQIAETPTPTPTPTATDLSTITTYTISGCTNLNTLVVDLGPGFIVPGDVFYFTFSGATPEGCYSVVGKINAPIQDAYLSSFGYGNCNDCEIANVTPTPTETLAPPTPTPSVTQTQTPTVTPTLTPTPSTSPIPVTGYGYNLVVLPYNYPSTGNTIMNNPPTNVTGSTNPNLLNVNGRGLFFNAIDMDGVDRTSYFSQFTGQSITITISQIGSTAIYSGDSKAFQSWSGTTGVVPPGVPGKGFVFGAGLTQPGYSAGTTTLIQSAATDWVTGQTVYISAVIN